MREREKTRDEAALEELVENVAEGLWLRLRDIMMVARKLEEFVF
jgi:hypothetical protein